ncbi:hypothetical protein TNCV_3251951 [Trichonephila clavipes]|nr:hypothetical protein TNCV_3251951 [Trichonephila clavipes]
MNVQFIRNSIGHEFATKNTRYSPTMTLKRNPNEILWNCFESRAERHSKGLADLRGKTNLKRRPHESELAWKLPPSRINWLRNLPQTEEAQWDVLRVLPRLKLNLSVG